MPVLLTFAGGVTTLVSIEFLLSVLLGLLRDVWVAKGAALVSFLLFRRKMRRTLCIPALHSRGRGLRWTHGFGFGLGAWFVFVVDV
jgi:hypothetical protein